MTRKENRSRSGSILMEAVLIFPVYIVVLGGMFWVGDLILAKQKLVIADRYAAWNAGNRHLKNKGSIQSEIQNTYFRPDEVGEQDVFTILYEGGKPTSWCTPVAATVYLNMRMPEWTEGWLAGSPSWEAVNPPPNAEIQLGRDVEQIGRHVVFMRTLFSEYAYRSPKWTPKMLADWSRPWDWAVWHEAWPTVGDLTPISPSALLLAYTPSGPPGYEHTRHAAYVTWSD